MLRNPANAFCIGAISRDKVVDDMPMNTERQPDDDPVIAAAQACQFLVGETSDEDEEDQDGSGGEDE